MQRPLFHEWRPHPWHGLETGREPPLHLNAYIEITPFDHIKYEVDKVSGYLRVDRPQRTSSHSPSLYGFVPRTYCGAAIAALCPGAERGDADDKLIPGAKPQIAVQQVYGVEHAARVVEASIADYKALLG